MKRVFTGFCLVLLSACTTEQIEIDSAASREFRQTVVVSGEPNFHPKAGARLCAHPTLAEALRNPLRSDVAAYDAVQKELIKQALMQGYQAGDAKENKCDYWVAFALARSQQVSDDQLISMFGVSPGLMGEDDEDMQRVTLFLRWYQANTDIVLWQLSMQGFAQMTEDATGRRQLAGEPGRLSSLVERVFSYLPEKQ